MPQIDWPLEQLKKYKPKLNRQKDFDKFWKSTLKEAHAQPLRAKEQLIPHPIKMMKAYKITFDGFESGSISGYYIRPVGKGPFPVILNYHGYTGHKGFPHDYVYWVAMGCAVCTIDTRDQTGESYDGRAFNSGHSMGWLSKGLESPEKYYYRAVYMDCVRAIDFVTSKEEIDKSLIAVTGGSQGGALSLATAALDSRVKICMADMPFLCHFQRALEVSSAGPYLELINYFKHFAQRVEQGWKTISYFDNLNLADHIKATTLMSVGLQDTICPPSTIYAVYNHLKTSKEMVIYPYHAHEWLSHQTDFKIRWLANKWRIPIK